MYNMEEMHEGFHLNCTIKATKTHSIQNNLKETTQPGIKAGS